MLQQQLPCSQKRVAYAGTFEPRVPRLLNSNGTCTRKPIRDRSTPLCCARGLQSVSAASTETQSSTISGHAEDATKMQEFLLWLTAQGVFVNLGALKGLQPLLTHASIGSAGVDDLQKDNCKLGVYNAEKGERGMLSLQVCMAAWPHHCHYHHHYQYLIHLILDMTISIIVIIIAIVITIIIIIIISKLVLDRLQFPV